MLGLLDALARFSGLRVADLTSAPLSPPIELMTGDSALLLDSDGKQLVAA